jgi:hypothetical protein
MMLASYFDSGATPCMHGLCVQTAEARSRTYSMWFRIQRPTNTDNVKIQDSAVFRSKIHALLS